MGSTPPEDFGNDVVDAKEIVVYDAVIRMKDDSLEKVECISSKISGNILQLMWISDIADVSSGTAGSDVGATVFVKKGLNLDNVEEYRLHPSRKVTVHPDDVQGEFVDL